eukprot:TRINITY_DN1723_c0_g1_i2.p1 TRINITY_DN1723_c0_g1~~TRINITY_DN1723_c0_g1_i2.p1  ORF type:complete len:442 (-),score=129.97 TRINITY_DN1723_c0_g1_i2:37-1362(-)
MLTPKKSIARRPLENMNDLVSAMADPKKGLDIKDRKKTLKNFPSCFVATEGVNWMLQNLPIRDRDDAVELGNRLVTAKYIKNLTEPGKAFKDNDAFWAFEDMGSERGSVKEAPDQTQDTVTEADFTILKVIGQGGFGRVLLVAKKDTEKIYAMKVMHKTKISGTRQLQCLIAEKNIMLNDNPFLVHLHYSFQTPEQLYFVMDFISGGDLAHHLTNKGRFIEKEVRFITAEIVLALEHLHSCGVIYRDLKLENILLDKDGHVCLTDFGLSKELSDVNGTTATVCGTPTYLAPEVLLGQPYGNAIDWWSLGVVLYELFTGMNPFDSRDFDSVLHNILHANIVVPDYVPAAGANLIESLLQRAPVKRLCSGATGSAEIQNHPFYKSMDWKKLMFKQSKAPFVPKLGEDHFDVDALGSSIEPPKADKPLPQLEFGDFDFTAKSVV